MLLFFLTMILIVVMDLIVSHFQFHAVMENWRDYKYNTGNLYSLFAILISFIYSFIVDFRLRKKASKKKEG
ncbi:hypothetical protein [Bacillus massilinigeriensis]|uniref:hypothetical protein n=1 Tax=Bacillus massilionigeriensis TaxID=1805475 RepID=UPI0013565F18|nr:hypothetical protein [Bacillus massilionigeriensis]